MSGFCQSVLLSIDGRCWAMFFVAMKKLLPIKPLPALWRLETLDCVGRRGAPQANLFTVLKEDLELGDFNFSNFEKFNSLRDIARDCTRWQSLF